jgi:hypothetical protein
MRIERVHLKAWLVFVATFSTLHFVYCAFVIIRAVILRNGGEGMLGFIFVFMPSGPLAGFEFAVGYALCEIITSVSRASSFRVEAIRALVAGFVSYSLLWVVLSMHTYMPVLSDSVGRSYYLGLILDFRLHWGAMLLGALSAMIVSVSALGVSWVFGQTARSV